MTCNCKQERIRLAMKAKHMKRYMERMALSDMLKKIIHSDFCFSDDYWWDILFEYFTAE